MLDTGWVQATAYPDFEARAAMTPAAALSIAAEIVHPLPARNPQPWCEPDADPYAGAFGEACRAARAVPCGNGQVAIPCTWPKLLQSQAGRYPTPPGLIEKMAAARPLQARADMGDFCDDGEGLAS